MSSGFATRFKMLDRVRGFAVVLMVIFHFCLLLNWFGLGVADFYQSPTWPLVRGLILSLFIGVSGVSAGLSLKHFELKKYLLRLTQLVLYALAVTLASFLYAPDRLVLMGVLHFFVVASLLGLLFYPLGKFNLLLGALVIIIGNQYSHNWFDTSSGWWLGLMTQKPLTLDYVPLFPWMGVYLLGFGLSQGFPLVAGCARELKSQQRFYLTGLELLGRQSLNIYILHIPLIFVSLWVYAKIL